MLLCLVGAITLRIKDLQSLACYFPANLSNCLWTALAVALSTLATEASVSPLGLLAPFLCLPVLLPAAKFVS